MKYLFSLLILLAGFSVEAETEIKIRTLGGMPIDTMEFYQSSFSDWVLAEESTGGAGDPLFALVSPNLGAQAGDLFIRINGDDSLVFSWTPPPEWPALGNRYVPDISFEVGQTGVVLRILDFVKDGFSVVVNQQPNESVTPVFTPLYQGVIAAPVTLDPVFMVRVAIYDTWVTQVSRMWVVALPMFGLGLIAFIYAASKKWGGKVAGA